MIYAIGDIHGRLDLLQNLYTKIIEDIKIEDDPFGALIIFLGDYIDRGPDGKGVLDFLIGLSDYDYPNVKHICLFGNHELMMCDSWQGTYSNTFGMWAVNGGVQTMESFGVPVESEQVKNSLILEPYVDWCMSLPLYHQTADYFFCHSGHVNLNAPLESQINSLVWGRPHRGQYVGSRKWIIHGHTPQQNGQPLVDVNRVNVDVGSCWTNNLCCVVLPHHGLQSDMQIRFIQLSDQFL